MCVNLQIQLELCKIRKAPACADIASRRASASSAFAKAAASCASANAWRWRASAMGQALKVHAC